MTEQEEAQLDEAQFLQQIEASIASDEFHDVNKLVQQVPLEDRVRVISRLPAVLQQQLLEGMGHHDAAEFLNILPDVQAVELLEEIRPEAAAHILEELPKDEQADLVGEMPAPAAEAILAKMGDSTIADVVRKLSSYQENEAGAIMIAEFLSFEENQSVDQVIQHLRNNATEYSDFDVQYAYVIDGNGELVGVLRLRDLLLSRPSTNLRQLMIKDPFSVNDKTSLDDLHELFSEHSYIGVPVIDQDRQLIGVVLRGDVEEALGDRATSDYLKSQGIISEELRTMPLAVRSRRRLSWLSINIVLNILAASVIAFYQETLSQVIALAVFLPIISDMSGCSGNQAVAVSMRELSLGVVNPTEVMRVWLKEISVGLINGFSLGCLIALVAYFWQGNAVLGVVVGIAMMFNTLIAVSLGGTLPLIMRRLNLDPALASGPILTTVTDMCGFFLVLSLASFWLDSLI